MKILQYYIPIFGFVKLCFAKELPFKNDGLDYLLVSVIQAMSLLSISLPFIVKAMG